MKTSDQNLVNRIINRTALLRAVKLMLYPLFAKEAPLASKQGKVMEFFRTNPLPIDTIPLLSEGITPEPVDITQTKINATLQQYGRYIVTSDLTQATEMDPALQDAVDTLGEDGGAVLNKVAGLVLTGGTSVSFAGGVAARSEVASLVTKDEIRSAQSLLSRNGARTISRYTPTDTSVATQPLSPAFIAICHTDLESTIEGLSGFIPAASFPAGTEKIPGTFGQLGKVLFLTAPDALVFPDAGAALSGLDFEVISTSGTNADVYPIVIVGADAYGRVALDGQNFRIIRTSPGGNNDPLEQRATTAWKADGIVYKLLNDAYVTRLECLAAA